MTWSLSCTCHYHVWGGEPPRPLLRHYYHGQICVFTDGKTDTTNNTAKLNNNDAVIHSPATKDVRDDLKVIEPLTS